MLSENECNNTLFFKGQEEYTLFVKRFDSFDTTIQSHKMAIKGLTIY